MANVKARGHSIDAIALTGSQSNFQRENPHYGFNSTSQRFSYLKEMQRMAENPGPGAYDAEPAIG